MSTFHHSPFRVFSGSKQAVDQTQWTRSSIGRMDQKDVETQLERCTIRDTLSAMMQLDRCAFQRIREEGQPPYWANGRMLLVTIETGLFGIFRSCSGSFQSRMSLSASGSAKRKPWKVVTPWSRR